MSRIKRLMEILITIEDCKALNTPLTAEEQAVWFDKMLVTVDFKEDKPPTWGQYNKPYLL